MQFQRDELQTKIASLALEARYLRIKEQQLQDKAEVTRVRAIGEHRGFKRGSEMPEALREDITRRTERLIDPSDPWNSLKTIDRITRKSINRFLRAGLTKEEILAIPGVQKSLRYEPRIASLHMHRKHHVRHEARHAQLAYAFLRGRPYSKTEDRPSSYPNWEKIRQIAKRFRHGEEQAVLQRFAEWEDNAREFIRGRELMHKATYRREPQIVA